MAGYVGDQNFITSTSLVSITLFAPTCMTEGDAEIAKALDDCDIYCHLLSIWQWHLLSRNGPMNLEDQSPRS